eukprot:symbB.v1.2.035589.t1/scaffold4833.1/size34140/2
MSCDHVMYCWCQGYTLRHSLFDVTLERSAPGDLDESTRGCGAICYEADPESTLVEERMAGKPGAGLSRSAVFPGMLEC